MKYIALTLTALGATALLGGCAGMQSGGNDNPFAESSFQKILKNDFVSKGQAKVDRLKQVGAAQYECSKYDYLGKPMPEDVSKRIESQSLAAVVPPADGKYLGDWKAGLEVASDGKGMQWNDKPGSPNGGNCEACHKLVPNDPSQGDIGPPLVGYGRLRGASDAMLKYTWARIYDSASFNACSYMPPFGAHHILTEQQMKDVMALLFDPNSPVNK